MVDGKGVIILWAPRSPCNLGCQYCYFGTLDDARTESVPLRPGELSHVGKNDVPLHSLISFIQSFNVELVHRVFIAGGEPLVWPGCRMMIQTLKAAGCQVVVCTNGLPLQDEHLCQWLVEAGVDAVSISLDSHDAEYNDHWRVDRRGDGWAGVVGGIRTLVTQRARSHSDLQIGVYSVISRLNIGHIVPTARLVSDLGVDYYIIQPVSLADDHALHDILSMNESHHRELMQAISELMSLEVKLYLPNKGYLKLFLRSLSSRFSRVVPGCFGGRDLFFIEPDGSVWDCPSMYKIAETPIEEYVSIVGQSSADIFSASRRARNTDCSCFSQDCVNMWQLMAFDDILGARNVL